LSENIFSTNFGPPIFVIQTFAPPNIYDKSTPLNLYITSLSHILLCHFVDHHRYADDMQLNVAN